MQCLKKDQRISIVKTIMDSGKNVQDRIYAQDIYQGINIGRMRDKKNISIIGFNNLMNFSVLENGKSD